MPIARTSIHHERRVFLLALASRLCVLAIMVTADAAFQDLDTSTHLQNFPCDASIPHTHSTTIIDQLAPWDSVYFIRIAKCGYENDKSNAFFPLLPLLMRYTAKLTFLDRASSTTHVPIESTYTLIGLFVSLISFSVAAVALWRLSLLVFGDEEQGKVVAAMAVLLFCCNPASVFYSAAYTESVYTACSWLGLLSLHSSPIDSARRDTKTTESNHNKTYIKQYIHALFWLTLSTAARSNGILLAWYLVHHHIRRACMTKTQARSVWRGYTTIAVAMSCIIVCIPYLAMQGTFLFSLPMYQ